MTLSLYPCNPKPLRTHHPPSTSDHDNDDEPVTTPHSHAHTSDESSSASSDDFSASPAWADIKIDLDALRSIVCQVLHEPPDQCGPPVAIGLLHRRANFARVYSFQLATRKVVARLVLPVKPLFKTESEVAAMDFVRSRTSLPVPTVFAYCSEANNPVGVEWLIMEYMPGVEMGDAWDNLGLSQKRRLALDIIDLYDQLFRLKADGCGSIYHSFNSVDDHAFLANSSPAKHPRSPRWAPLSLESLRLLKSHCNHPIHDRYELGPVNDIPLVLYHQKVPSPSQTLPIFSSDEYFKLLAFNGNLSARSVYDIPTREKCVQLFQSINKLYPNSTVFGPPAELPKFYFSHGDLHDGNIIIDPQSGAITGIIDWEGASFRPLWADVCGVGWFEEDGERFILGSEDPGNFVEDTLPGDAELRAFFRTELNKRNPDLFSSFLGAIELRAVFHAAVDLPRPFGETNIFLPKYGQLGYWIQDRRGPFPWDMNAWMHRRFDLDEEEMALEAKERLQV